ncbi:nucleotidyltransferase [Streptococcus anginosus]|uniref:nucleotidyltransferase n=1 Tax=Streptococcus anginosus TaxID=1328 RepID=UPI000D02E67A|nr:nucleotidyltransferase [Streptococcus anginosus]PRT76914.1 nucleotidyltransferase [Streptococcus anginosus]
MTITGIIAEFNPFHNGHKYLLSQAEGVKIVAMSGNFVQRGEPAIVDKWTRAEMALRNGADLVVELPFLVAVQSADYFAQGAVDILERLSVNKLTFGTEEVLDYQHFSQIYIDNQQKMVDYVQSLPDDLSYPQKTQKMWEKFAGVKFTGNTPNHILGLSYAKACAGKAIEILPIKRQGAGYHSQEENLKYASATALRERLNCPDFLEKFTPAHELLIQSPKVTWSALYPLLRYQIISHLDLTSFYQVNRELSVRLQEAVKTSYSVEELVEQVATKRYTKARIRRILTYILVGARNDQLPSGIHILGFTQAGREHLKKMKGKTDFVSRIGQEPWDSLTQRADCIYQLGNAQLEEQNFGRIPIMID